MFKQLFQLVGLKITRTGVFKVNPSCLLTRTLPMTSSSFFCTESQRDDDDNPHMDMSDPFVGETPKCVLCKSNVPITYKNVQLLSQFISPNTGHIYGQNITKLCKIQQKRISREISKSRRMGFMPVMYRDIIFLKDPDLFGSHYTGNVNIGGAVRLEPKPPIEELVQRKQKKPEKRFKKQTDSKKQNESKKAKKK